MQQVRSWPMKKFALFFFGFFSCMIAHAQTDTAFWFVAPEVTSTHGDRPIYLRFTALEQDAKVTVSIPANGSFFPQAIFVPANSSRSIDLTPYIEIIENKPADQVLNHGLLIQSSAFITAYYEVARPNNTDIFSLKGRNALGTDFLIPSQNIMYNVTFTPPAFSSFEIVATEDNTHITITTSNNITGHLAGETFTITLNKGETYSAAASGTAASQHLMGSVVKSDKPIAITVKDDSMSGGGYGGCYDLGGDQLVPVPLTGTKYITLPGYLNIPSSQPTDNVFILGIEDNTTVNINGSFATNLQRGQTFLKRSFNDVFYIETSKSVYVYQLSGFGCEVGESLLPQIECTGSKTVGFTRSTQEPLYMNIIVAAGGEGSFTFNGSAGTISASQFSIVPFTNGEWKYARIQLSTGQLPQGGAAIVKNSLKAFQLSIIHGDAQTGCRYGYFSNYNSLIAAASTNIPANGSLCTGQILQLYCDVGGTGTGQTSFLWKGPNGFVSIEQNPVIQNITTANAGEYTCIANKAGCTTDTTTIGVEIYDYPSANASSNTPLCQGQQLKLFAAGNSPNATYSWEGPNGFTSNLQNPVFTTVANNSGNYILTASRKSCAVKDTLPVQIDVNPGAHPFSGSPYCSEDSIVLNTTIPPNAVNNNASFLWTGPNGFISNLQRTVIYNAQPNQSGIYTLKVNAPACGDSTASITVSVTQSPIAAASFNMPVCENRVLQLNGANTLAGSSFSWTGPNSFISSIQNPFINNVSVTASGDYILKTSLSVCATSDTISVTVNRIPSAFISANETTCEYKQIVITNNNTVPNTTYQWTGPNGFTSSQQNITIDNAAMENAGTYSLLVYSNGCKDSSATNVAVKSSPFINFPPLNNLCQEANAFQINGVTETTGISGSGVFTGNGVSATGFFNPLLAGSGTHFIRYTFTADDGCDNYGEQPITVFATPVVNVGDDKVIIEGSTIKLNASVTGNIKTLQWVPSTYLDNTTIQNPNATPKADILYKLHVITTDNCTADDSVFIKVLAKIGIPNAFSPNKDGINEKWVLDGLASFPTSKLVVYNRYGQVVFTSTGYIAPWDGTYKNNPLPVGTYYYILYLNDGYRKEPITGWVAILR